MPELPEPDDELLLVLEEGEDLAFVLLSDFAFVEEADEDVPLPVVDLLLLPDVEPEEEADGEPDLDEDEPELPILLLLLLPIDDELEDPDVLSDMLPEPWFFSLSFIVKISWIYIVKK